MHFRIKGAIVGMIVGAIGGFAVGAIAFEWGIESDPRVVTLLGVIIGAFVGALEKEAPEVDRQQNGVNGKLVWDPSTGFTKKKREPGDSDSSNKLEEPG